MVRRYTMATYNPASQADPMNNPVEVPFQESRGWLAALIVALIGAAALAILTRGVMQHAPLYDELLHVLSARGVVETGQPVIADGVYNRAQLYTRAAAMAMSVTDDDLIAARIPAWLGALALVALVGAWVTRKAGAIAGVASALLLAMSAWTIELAVFARFYTLHAFFVFIFFACAYEIASLRLRPATLVAYALGALVAFAIAFHLQVTSVIALGAVGAGVLAGLMAEQQALARQIWQRHWRWMVPTVVLALGAAAAVMYVLGFADAFRSSPLWSQGAANQVNFYNRQLAIASPLFWPLVPFAALATIVKFPRLGWSITITAAVILLGHSLAAAKATRYAYYCLPFVCILLGCGVAIALDLLSKSFSVRWPRLGGRAVLVALVLLGLSFMLSREGYKTARTALALDGPAEVLGYLVEADWSISQPVLRPAAERADVVVTSNAMKSLYYLGRYDYELNSSIVIETDTQTEFGRDLRTGRRAISTADSLERVLGEADSVLVVLEDEKLGSRYGVSPDAIEVLNSRCDRLTLPKQAQLTAWQCLGHPVSTFGAG